MSSDYNNSESDYKTDNHPHVMKIVGSGHGPGTFVPFELIAITGDAATAILFSQILYWSTRMEGRRFYKSVADWHAETKLSERVIRRIVRGNDRSEKGKPTLIDLGIEVSVHRANGAPTYHYRINYRKLSDFLQDYYGDASDDGLYTKGTNPHIPKVQIDMHERYKSLTEDYTEEKTTHVATDEPPRGVAKNTSQQVMVGALLEAFAIDKPTQADGSKAGKVAKQLMKVGVQPEDVSDLVAMVRNESGGRWNVTMTSLTTNGRVSKYLQAKARETEVVTMVTDDTPEDVLDEMQRQIELGRLRVEGDQKRHRGKGQAIDISTLYTDDGND